LWALTREIRMLAKLAGDLAAGQSFEQACRQLRIWDKRKAMINKALSRFSGVGWTAALRQAAFIDRVIKGDVAGNPWDELLKLALRMTGVALFGRTRKAG
jgi:DNA polymerase-3 subunit delta